MMLFRIYSIGCLLVFLTTSLVNGQDVQLDPITITSSLIEKRASETGRNLVTISGNTLSNLPVNSIDEMLRYLPGVEVQSRGPMGSQSDIVLRGGTFQQVLVIIDGLRLNDANTGHFSSYIPIAPSEIARIEILKGASSALYGSEAVGGVIHIITKSFQSKLDSTSTSSPQLTGTISTGMNRLWSVQGGGNWQNNSSAFSIGILSNNAQGEEQRGTHGYFHNHTLSASGKTKLNRNTTLAVRGSLDYRDFAAQNFYTTLAADTASEKVKSSLIHVQLNRQLQKGSIAFNAGHKHLVDQYSFNPSSLVNNSTSRLSQALISWTSNTSTFGKFVTGIHYQLKQISSNDRGNHARNTLSPFLSYHYSFRHVHIQPSMRLDWRQTLGVEWVPQLNVSYRYGQWQWRSTVGKTIRDADFTERFNNYNKPYVNGGSIGYPLLKAEKSLSYELGADWFYSSCVKLSTSFFTRHHYDLIDYLPTHYSQMPRQENLNPYGSFALAQNVSQVTTHGMELDLQYSRSFTANRSLFLSVGNQWLKSKSPAHIISFYLSSHAKWMTNASVLYKVNRFHLSLNGLYKNRSTQTSDALQIQLTPHYWTLNTRLQYHIPQSSFAIFIQIDNLTNTQYFDLLGSKMPGLWAMTGIKFAK